MLIRIVRFWRSTKLVAICFGSGVPLIRLPTSLADAAWRAVALPGASRRPFGAIDLDQLRVVDLPLTNAMSMDRLIGGKAVS